MLTYLLFRFSFAFPGLGTTAAGADLAAQAVVENKPVVEKKPIVAAAQNDNVDPTRPEKVDSAKVAQVRLAETLGTAEIHSVHARGNQVTFTITRGADIVQLVATTRRGEVTSLSIAKAPANAEVGGGLSWLGDEMSGITAITKLVADEDGAVTLTTDDGRRYMVIPGRGSGGSGNEAAASRFAGDFDHT